MATINQQFKINKLAKDLGLKSKDLVEVLQNNGIEAKTTQKALEPAEFDILFETLTRANQISNIGDYLGGVTHIPSKVKKTTVKAEEPKKEEAPVAEVAPKAETPKQAEEPKKTPPVKEEVAKTAPVTDAPKKVEAPKTEAPKKAENPAEVRPQNGTANKQNMNTQAQAGAPAPRRSSPQQPYTGNPYRPQQNGTSPATAPRAPISQRAPFGSAPAQQGNRPAPQFGARDQRSGGFDRPQGGFERPQGGGFDRGRSEERRVGKEC